MRHVLNPKIFGLRPSMVAYLYYRRLRSHAVQELLAGGGVAVGVALFVGVLAASSTLTRAGDELVRGLVGHARVGLAARSLQEGFDERTAAAAGALPGVKLAVDLLRDDVTISGPRGKALVQLIGVSSNLASLGGADVAESGAEVGVLAGGLALPAAVAQQIGARAGETLQVMGSGEAHSVRLRALLSGERVEGLVNSPVAVTLLPVAQRLAARPKTVSVVLIEPQPGAAQLVDEGLKRLAGGRLEVDRLPAKELSLLAEATGPSRQSTTLFAAIGAMVGFLLALNAMLLTAPERRRFVTDLQTDGYDWRQVVLIVGFQVASLGLLASIVGAVIGEALARTVFHQSTAGLSSAFPLGTHEVVSLGLVAIALVTGLAATLLASAPVLIDLLPWRTANTARHRLDVEVIGSRITIALAVFAVVVIAAETVLVISVPSLTIAGVVVLGVAVPCLIPAVFSIVVRGLDWLSERVASSSLIVAVRELVGSSAHVVVVGSVVGLAVYSTAAVSGAQHDLFAGEERNIVEYFGAANIWVAPPNNLTNTMSFGDRGTAAKLAQLPVVSSLRIDRGTYEDVGNRRMWISAPPPQNRNLIPPGQVVTGNLERANRLLRAGGWAAVSAGLANERNLQIGGPMSLDTPSGTISLKVAAIITNIGWPPGSVIMNAGEYQRYWQTSDPSAYEIDLKSGVSPAAGRRAVRAALAGRSGLFAETSAERIAYDRLTFEKNLENLTVISTLLLVAAAVAVALALSAAIWQRRMRLAALKIQGYDYRQLWRALLLESTVVLGVGWVVGIVLGEYGHRFGSRWLEITTGFPVRVSVGGVGVLVVLGLVVGVALVVVSLPGLAAARVSPRLSFQE